MSQKVEKPVLSGQRIKTRKRDEKEKYDPNGFRDALVVGLERAGDLDAAYKFLDAAGSKLDYRRYGEVIFDVLIAGGLLLPGGSVSMDGESPKTNTCIFNASEDMDSMRNFEQVFVKLMRRYKYLEKMFEEEMKKVLVYLKGFEPLQRIKLARMTALWIGNGCVPPSVLLVLVNEHLLKENLALEFVLEVFATVKAERGVTSLVTALKRGQLEGRLLEFLPLNRRSEDVLASAFASRGLAELLRLHRAQASQEARRELTQALQEQLADERPVRDLIQELRDMALRHDIPEHEVVAIIWQCVMSRGEWNKKEELLAEQAAKHLRHYTPLLAAFAQSAKAEIALLTKVQEYCYENMSFMRAFSKLVLMLYKSNVLSEEVILKWYRDPNSSKGKVMFLDQMKKFVEWLQSAEEDEKEKYDPNGFRDALVVGLERAGDLDAAYKFLDAAGSKLDYRRYGEVIFDVLIAGGLLLPGGSVSMDGESPKTNTCIFNASEDMDSMRNFEQVFVKLMRRYKYLEKMFEEEMKKVLVYLKGFEPLQRIKLARMTALWIGNGCVPPSVLLVLVNEHLLKENLALEFVLEVFATVKAERGVTSLVTALKRGQLEGRLLEFLPLNRRSEDVLASAFASRGLAELLRLHRAQASQEARRELTQALQEQLADERPVRDLIQELRDMALRHDIPEHEVVAIIWQCVMSRGEWNKKEELLAEQAAKHLRHYTPLLAAFAQSAKAEIALLTKVQEYCYENMSFMRAFSKLVLMLYKSNVLSEEVILKWYRDPNSSKGKVMFLDQMKKFVEWLQSAEEDEKEKYDPNGFRDALVVGLERAGDLDAAYKFLDAAGSKLDYRRYGEVIFDVLIAGGLLLPGGSVSMDGESPKTNTCIFNASEDMDSMRNFEQVFVKLMRRYKYLEKMFEEEMKKVLVYLKGFEPLQRIKLARMTALWIGNGCVPPSVLLVLVNEHLLKENLALEFVLEVFATVKAERGVTSLVTALKRGQLEGRLLEFLPLNRRSEDVLASAFASRGLAELLRLHRAQASQEARRELTQALQEQLADERPVRDLIQELRDMALRHDIPEHEVVAIIWQCVMSRGEWNKKEELLAEQAAKHLRHYTPLLAAFAQSAKAEIALLTKVQEYCYENMSFMRAFSKLVLMLYKSNVLSEEVILKWYRDPNSSKGKVMFLDQMKKFVEWLQSAEEESESGEEED